VLSAQSHWKTHGNIARTAGQRPSRYQRHPHIDTYVQNKVSLELSNRLKDQTAIVRELGDKAEDVVWKRLTHYSILFGLLLAVILGFLTFLGIKTVADISTRIEPVVSAAEQRAQAAKRTTEEAATQIDSVKASLDQLSRDVESQAQRVSDKGGEISQKLEDLDTAANAAQKRGDAYRVRSEELAVRLEGMEKSLESKVDQLSKQVENVSILQAYPTLGQPMFVTYQGGHWKGPEGKEVNEKWINIYIDPMAVGDFSNDQITNLMDELTKSGYTPLLGLFGVGGPYITGFGRLGDRGNGTTVFYFNKNAEQVAVYVSRLVSEALSNIRVEPIFEDLSDLAVDDARRFVIQNSGLDLQLFLRSPQR
jgi:hypothetical protein